MLWLCLHFPHLPLEVFQRGDHGDTPLAVLDGGRVFAAGTAASRDGVRPGMRLAAARALLPRLCPRERDREAETRALGQLAAWSLQYTSRVSLQPPRALLLEIGGSLRYFEGLQSLCRRIRQGLVGLGYRHVPGIAPTPTAALLLARAGHKRPVIRTGDLAAALRALPIRVLDLDHGRVAAMEGLGIGTLGDCLRLPREGLSRRLGPGPIRQLDRAMGRLPEPRRFWQPPPHFDGALELPVEVHDTRPLIFGINRLIRELCGYLQGTGSGTQRFRIGLRHSRRTGTSLDIGLVTPSRDPDHLLDLVRQRLESLAIPAPTTGLTLTVPDIRPLPPANRPLMVADEGTDAAPWETLLEQLSARLGEHAVRGVRTRPEHRPEHAWEYAPPGRPGPAASSPERPLWLLARPQRLEAPDGRPLWRGMLVLQRGPERIETGWWDGRDVTRDYYVAVNAAGERVWVFRDRRNGWAWYLHGLFA